MEIVQAVLQSPGFIPVRGNILGRETIFKSFMAAANCSDLECLRHIPTDIIMKANAFISSSDTNINTTIGPGPVVSNTVIRHHSTSNLMHFGASTYGSIFESSGSLL